MRRFLMFAAWLAACSRSHVTEVPEPTLGDFTAAWGSAPNDVWAVGRKGVVVHYDGSTWARVTVPTDRDLVAVSGAEGDVWMVGGGNVSDRHAARTCVILHRPAGTREFQSVTCPPEAGAAAPGAVAALGKGNAIVAGGFVHERNEAVLLQRKEGAWTVSHAPGSLGFTSMWVNGPNDVWAVDASHVAHFDGVGWQASAVEPHYAAHAVFGGGAGDMWIAGSVSTSALQPASAHLENGHWEWTSCPPHGATTSLVAGVASPPGHAWAADADGTLYALGVRSCKREQTLRVRSIGALWGVGPDTFWIAGWNGRMLLYR